MLEIEKRLVESLIDMNLDNARVAMDWIQAYRDLAEKYESLRQSAIPPDRHLREGVGCEKD